MTWTNQRLTRGMTWQVRTWDTWQHQGVPRGMLIWHFWQANGQYQGDTCHHSQGDTWHQVTSSLTWRHGKATRGCTAVYVASRWSNHITPRVRFWLAKKGCHVAHSGEATWHPMVGLASAWTWFRVRWRNCWQQGSSFYVVRVPFWPTRTGFPSFRFRAICATAIGAHGARPSHTTGAMRSNVGELSHGPMDLPGPSRYSREPGAGPNKRGRIVQPLKPWPYYNHMNRGSGSESGVARA
jgi:hypothetical protein